MFYLLAYNHFLLTTNLLLFCHFYLNSSIIIFITVFVTAVVAYLFTSSTILSFLLVLIFIMSNFTPVHPSTSNETMFDFDAVLINIIEENLPSTVESAAYALTIDAAVVAVKTAFEALNVLDEDIKNNADNDTRPL